MRLALEDGANRTFLPSHTRVWIRHLKLLPENVSCLLYSAIPLPPHHHHHDRFKASLQLDVGLSAASRHAGNQLDDFQ